MIFSLGFHLENCGKSRCFPDRLVQYHSSGCISAAVGKVGCGTRTVEGNKEKVSEL